ncbi:hypothetical protein Bca52824_005857 [Brassica carinata]|uniref:Uncharacterized protein n=1 Tax=Brassica carinata TaxID=52824 RepID=A0A8X8BHV5_BRACI|nr:hypothetical protein Bca52824_005857 [Brassica carinata]
MQDKMQRLFNQQPPRPVRGGGRGAGPAAPPVPPVRRPRPRRYPDVSIAELLASPSRLQMPLIHPEKENNGLWFKIDKCLTDDCTSIYTSDWRGAWHNYSMVSDEMKLTWWGDFVAVPPYKGRVYGLGSAHCYYGDYTPSTSTAIPRTMQLETRVTSIECNMSSMQGNMNSMATDIAAIMEASHGRAKKIVEEVEAAVTHSEGHGGRAVPPYKGRVYGLGSAHCYYGDYTPSTSTAIPRTMQLETRVTSIECNMSSMQGNMNSMATTLLLSWKPHVRLLEANGIDPSVVLKSTTTNPAEPVREATPEQQSPALNRQTQAPPTTTTPINLADMEPQSFDGFFEE